MSRVAIIQPNYIPWKGYFDIIHDVDTFVFLDDVQYTLRDWRNRNRIQLPSGEVTWLSVPTLGGRNQRICDVHVDRSQPWAKKHLHALQHSYARAPHFSRYFPRIVELLESDWDLLVDLDIALTRATCDWLGLNPRIYRSSELDPQGSKDDRLIDIVQKVGGSFYLSGPAARDYIRPERFSESHITLAYHDYSGYPTYTQIAQPFDHFVTVLDLLFAVGDAAPDYIWGRYRAPRATVGASSFQPKLPETQCVFLMLQRAALQRVFHLRAHRGVDTVRAASRQPRE